MPDFASMDRRISAQDGPLLAPEAVKRHDRCQLCSAQRDTFSKKFFLGDRSTADRFRE